MKKVCKKILAVFMALMMVIPSLTVLESVGISQSIVAQAATKKTSSEKVSKEKTSTKKTTVSTPKNLKVTAKASNSLDVSFSKVNKANGYVIYYSTSKEFTKKTTKKETVKVTKKLAKKKTVTKRISKLKNNKKYYVKVCAYRVVDKKQIYSKYTSVKSAKAKNIVKEEVTTTVATTQPTTQAITQATTQPTTQATTQATTQPTTQATTEPTTQPTTEPTTEPNNEKLVIETFEFSPNAVETYNESTVIAKIKVNYPDDIDKTDICFYLVNDDETICAELLDDGIGCDDIAGDNVYCTEIEAYSEEVKTELYTIKVDGFDDDFTTKSSEINYYDMTVALESQNVANNISDKISEIEGTIDTSEVTPQIAEETLNSVASCFDDAKANGNIVDYTIEGLTITADLKCGAYVYNAEDMLYGDGDDEYNTKSLMVSNSSISSTYDVASIQPFADDLSSSVFDDSAQAIENLNCGYSFSSNVDNEEVSVSFLKKLAKYKVIIWNGHGGYSSSLHSFIATGEEIIDGDTEFASDIATKRLVYGSSGRYLVTSKFFDYYYANNKFNNSLIYIGACHGCDDAVLANTLIQNGASAVLGFNESVTSKYDQQMCKALFSELVKYDNDAVMTKTIKDALAYAKKVNGNKDPYKSNPAELILFEKDSKNSFRLIDVSDDNLSFENGLVNWGFTGDARVLQQMGDVKPVHGNNFVAIGTGLGAVSDSVSTITRTFVKTEGVSKLTFQYDFVSEEPLEYVGSRYNDYFDVVATASNNVFFNETLESVNTSEWIELGGNYFYGGDETTYHTGWKTVAIDLSSLKTGEVFTISLTVGDKGDSIYDSAAALDNFVFE